MDLLFWPDKKLSQVCVDAEFDDDLVKLVGTLEYLVEKHGGVGLAAPQLGVLKNVVVCKFMVKGKDGEATYGKPVALVNPQVIETAETCLVSIEGCLSLPGARAMVKTRKEWITVASFDVEGMPTQSTFKFANSVILQHELDHLSGILLLDKVSRLKKQMMEKRVRKTILNAGKSQ